MSEPPSPSARPRQVTMAGWLTMLGSAVVLLLVFDRVSGLHSLETRDSIEQFLAEPPGRDLGLQVDGVQAILRTFALVAGGCATAAAILGWHVLKRSRSARLALTIVAVPLFLTGLVTGGFVSSVVAASAVMLWLQPARDWFDGIVREPQPSPRPAGPFGAAARSAQPPVSEPIAPPPPAAQQPTGEHAFGQHAFGQPSSGQPAGGVPVPARPAAVAWACILTWAGSAMTAIGVISSGVYLGLQPDALVDEVRRQNPELEAQGISDEMLIGVTLAMLGGFLVWCLAAAAVAVFVFRGLEWARITLVVSAATSAAIFLLGTVLGAVVLAATLATSVLSVALLVRPEVRAWFQAKRASAAGPHPPAGAAPPR